MPQALRQRPLKPPAKASPRAPAWAPARASPWCPCSGLFIGLLGEILRGLVQGLPRSLPAQASSKGFWKGSSAGSCPNSSVGSCMWRRRRSVTLAWQRGGSGRPAAVGECQQPLLRSQVAAGRLAISARKPRGWLRFGLRDHGGRGLWSKEQFWSSNWLRMTSMVRACRVTLPDEIRIGDDTWQW